MAIKYLEMSVGEYGKVKVEIEPTEVEELGLSGIRSAPSRGFEDLGLKRDLARATRDVTAEATKAFDAISSNIHTLAHGFRQSVYQIEEKARPDEFSIEFGLALKADAGVVITGLWEAGGGGEANFKVVLTWKLREETE